MAAFLLVVLLAGAVSAGSVNLRYPRAAAGGGFGSMAGSGASSFASSSSFSGTNVAPGPGGSGNFNAYANNYKPSASDDLEPLTGKVGGGQPPFPGTQGAGYQGAGFPGYQGAGFSGLPGFTPYIPQYGQQYPFMPFPNFAAPFDFTSFLNQYFQALQSFQAQAEAQAQQAAANGHGVYQRYPGGYVYSYSYPRSTNVHVSGDGYRVDNNEVGGVGGVGGLATATYGPQGGYGSANIYPKPEGGLDSRFGGDDEAPQNSLGGGPVSSVGGSFKPPGGSSYGVFTSSASGSSDINGKKTSFKQSTIGVNDNGKVSTYTAHDP